MSPQQRSISAVTYMECVPFCRTKRERAVFENRLNALQFTIHEIDHAISYQARQLVRQFALSHNMEMGDAQIAETALAHKALLCTSNSKHFVPVKGLLLEADKLNNA